MYALLAIPVLSLPNRVSLFFQAFMLGLFLDGVGRWGWASIVETTDSVSASHVLSVPTTSADKASFAETPTPAHSHLPFPTLPIAAKWHGRRSTRHIPLKALPASRSSLTISSGCSTSTAAVRRDTSRSRRCGCGPTRLMPAGIALSDFSLAEGIEHYFRLAVSTHPPRTAIYR